MKNEVAEAESARIAALTRRLAGNVSGLEAPPPPENAYEFRPDTDFELWEGRPISQERFADGTYRDERHPSNYDHARALHDQAYWNRTEAECRRAFSRDKEHAKQLEERRMAEEFEKGLAEVEAHRAKQEEQAVADADARQMASERAATNDARRAV